MQELRNVNTRLLRNNNWAFVYYWHLNDRGEIDYVVTFYVNNYNIAVQLTQNRTDIPGLYDLQTAETRQDAQKALDTLINSSWVKTWWGGGIIYAGIE